MRFGWRIVKTLYGLETTSFNFSYCLSLKEKQLNNSELNEVHCAKSYYFYPFPGNMVEYLLTAQKYQRILKTFPMLKMKTKVMPNSTGFLEWLLSLSDLNLDVNWNPADRSLM